MCTGEVWAKVVQALPWCHELNGSIVTRQQRLECLGPSKFKEEWCTHPAAKSKKHALFVRVRSLSSTSAWVIVQSFAFAGVFENI